MRVVHIFKYLIIINVIVIIITTTILSLYDYLPSVNKTFIIHILSDNHCLTHVKPTIWFKSVHILQSHQGQSLKQWWIYFIYCNNPDKKDWKSIKFLTDNGTLTCLMWWLHFCIALYSWLSLCPCTSVECVINFLSIGQY